VTDLALASLGLVLLLTPTGSAPSPGWRRWAFASSAAMAALAVAATLAPGSVDARVLSIEGPVGPTPSVAPWPWPPSSSRPAGASRGRRPALQPPPPRRGPDHRGVGDRLREEVDLDTLTAEVLGVAEQTMQPTRASLWLRPPPGSGVV
jgi:hypothetical protein